VNRRARIGILDSGVHATHPHVGGIAGGITIGPDGLSSAYEDRLGHGTAVAAVVHHMNPQAELFVVKIFDNKLVTSLLTVIRAIDWCLEQEIDVINLSLGTLNACHRGAFELAVKKSRRAAAVIVSALEINGMAALPGSLKGVIGVLETEPGSKQDYQICERYGKPVYTAPPFPRDIPGVPRERNLKGASFAVARVSALVAESWTANSGSHSWFDSMLPSLANDAVQFQASYEEGLSPARSAQLSPQATNRLNAFEDQR
jgi:subtilisin family serine protease